MAGVALFLLVFAADSLGKEGASLYLESDYARAARAFRKDIVEHPARIDLQLGYVRSLVKTELPANLKAAVTVTSLIPRQKDAALEAARAFTVADTARRLAEVNERRRRNHVDKQQPRHAKMEAETAVYWANRALNSYRRVSSKQLAPLVARGRAGCKAIVGHEGLDSAPKQVAIFAKAAAAARARWDKEEERTMVLDPLHALPLFKDSSTHYAKLLSRTIRDEIATRTVIAGAFERAKRHAQAIQQYTRILDLDPSHVASRVRRGLAYLELEPPNIKLARDDLTEAVRQSAPTARTDRVRKAIVYCEKELAKRQK